MSGERSDGRWKLPRRDFFRVAGAAAAGLPLIRVGDLQGRRGNPTAKPLATIRGAFVYPPSKKLHAVGYYSWPGSTFDAEGQQKAYLHELAKIERDLGLRLALDEAPLDGDASVKAFIQDVQTTKPDGLLLVPFKKGHWRHVVRIVEETKRPAVILAPLGVLLIGHIRQLLKKPGVFLINSNHGFASVAEGLKMIRTGQWMGKSVILDINRPPAKEAQVPVIGTRVRTIPHARFYKAFQEMETTPAVRALARDYVRRAQAIEEPTEADILEAAKTYFVFKRLLQQEKGDAIMMNCLPGLKRPHKHVPPCMGFMSLRDEGVAMGCESDLDATLTLMLLQELFDRPGFQHNPSLDTETNHYFCAHCTSASKMNGVKGQREPLILRNHAEAGWGCVPRVLMRPGQEVTIAKYLSQRGDRKPQLLLYSGKVVGCPPIPPTGGCRTNVETTIRELDDVCDLQGHHLCLVYGDFTRELRAFAQLYDIEVVV